jgi:flagellin
LRGRKFTGPMARSAAAACGPADHFLYAPPKVPAPFTDKNGVARQAASRHQVAGRANDKSPEDNGLSAARTLRKIKAPSGGDSRKEFMVINTNLSAESSARLLMQSQTQLSQSLARLSSGTKINSPADDSAGLAVSMNLTAQMGRNTAANDNVNNAISFNQTQDGYLQQVANALNRMSELAVQSQDVTKSDSDRSLYQQEFNTLAKYINSVSTKDFNGVSLFGGDTLNVTIDSDAKTFGMQGVDLTGTTFSTLATTDSIATLDTAQTALGDVKTAISQLAKDRALIGANIETLTAYGNQLSTLNNNLSAANSQITDVDVAQESTRYAKYNILVQTGTAMLAQANALPQSVLKLLG